MKTFSSIILGLYLIISFTDCVNANDSNIEQQNISSKHNNSDATHAIAGCYAYNGRKLKVGDMIVMDAPDCYKLHCISNNTTEYIYCPKIEIKGSGCTVTFFDTTQDFPKCCPTSKCPESSNATT